MGKGSLIANEYPNTTSQIKERLLSDLNERKIVKTISLRKKVAAIAVASLGFGLLSVAPAQAANTVLICDIADGRTTGTANFTTGAACNGVAGPANSVVFSIDAAAEADDRLTIAGAGGTFGASSAGNTTATNGLSVTLDGNAGTVVVNTPAVGTITVSLFRLTAAGGTIYSSTATDTVTITVTATAASGVVNTTKSKVMLSSSTDDTDTNIDFTVDDATVAVSGLTAGTISAYIGVQVRDALDAAVVGSTVKAEVTSGPGIVSVADLAANATYATGGRSDSDVTLVDNAGTLDAGTDVEGVVYVGVYADGTAGVASIRITAGTTVLATKTVTFYGNVTKVVATQSLSVASSAGATLGDDTSATAGAVYVTLTDSNNNPAVAAVTATPADTSVIASGNCSAVATKPGTYSCDVLSAANTSGKSTTVVFSAVGASSAVIKSDPVTFTLGGTTPSTVALSFDKATYTSGAPVVLTITAKDSSGNPIADGVQDNLTATAGLAFNYATGLSTVEDVIDDLIFLKGIATIKTFAPLSGGSISVSGTLGTGVATAAQGSAISATAAVTDASSAIATSISALNAKIVALNALIAKIMKRLNIR